MNTLYSKTSETIRLLVQNLQILDEEVNAMNIRYDSEIEFLHSICDNHYNLFEQHKSTEVTLNRYKLARLNLAVRSAALTESNEIKEMLGLHAVSINQLTEEVKKYNTTVAVSKSFIGTDRSISVEDATTYLLSRK